MMKVSNNKSPNFNAKFVSKAQVLKLDNIDNLYKQKNISFIEVNPKNKQDVKAIYNISKDWGKNSLAPNIKDTVIDLSRRIKNIFGIKIYALTTQNKNFRTLESDKVICLSEIIPLKDKIFLSYIQTKPNQMFSSNEKEYKNIGSTMIKTIRNKYNKPIVAHSLADAVPFYEKLGFKQKKEDSLDYIL